MCSIFCVSGIKLKVGSWRLIKSYLQGSKLVMMGMGIRKMTKMRRCKVERKLIKKGLWLMLLLMFKRKKVKNEV
jgi:hypothetical protein